MSLPLAESLLLDSITTLFALAHTLRRQARKTPVPSSRRHTAVKRFTGAVIAMSLNAHTSQQITLVIGMSALALQRT